MALEFVLVWLAGTGDVSVGVVVGEYQVGVVDGAEVALRPEFGVLGVGDFVGGLHVVCDVLLGDLFEDEVCVGDEALEARGGSGCDGADFPDFVIVGF